jgi:DNA-binding PadR family transcriptional regulator
MTLMALKPLVFEILLALVDEPRHGWDLVNDIQNRLGGPPLLPGNFYRTLRRMLADGLIEEAAANRRDDRVSDERRRYFQLTEQGMRVAQTEARRLEVLLGDRRMRRLLRAR